MLDGRTLFIADTFVNEDPDAATLAEIAVMSAEAVAQFGIEPRVAFLSHSMYGSSARPRRARCAPRATCSHSACPACRPMADAGRRRAERGSARDLPAVEHARRQRQRPDLPQPGRRHILFNVLKITGGHGITVGPILLGAGAPVHILTPSATVRRVVNMTALTVAGQAQTGRA